MNQEYQYRVKECASFFKERPSYDRLFRCLKEKYLSNTRVSGRIKIYNLSEIEQSAFGNLLGREYFTKSTLNVDVSMIKRAIDKTKFKDVELKDILFEYYGRVLVPRKVEKNIKRLQKLNYFDNLFSSYGGTPAFIWATKSFEEKNNFYKVVSRKYNEDKELLSRELKVILDAYNIIVKMVRDKITTKSPIFSAKITLDPHAFDEGTSLNNLLTEAICDILKENKPKYAEEKALLFYQAGLIKDEISNYTMCFNLISENLLFEAAYNLGVSFNPTVSNLKKVGVISAINDKVFVFENPPVYSEVVDKMSELGVGVSCVCTSGQIKYASLILLDKLVESGVAIYYNGDYDPEGLQIAERLKSRYGSKLNLLEYSEENFFKINTDANLDEKRLSKLENIKDKELSAVARLIELHRKVGYQELLVNVLLKKIIEISSL